MAITRFLLIFIAGCLLNALMGSPIYGAPIHIQLSVDRRQVVEGTSVLLHVNARKTNRAPASHVTLWPIWNDRRWGAEEETNSKGEATFSIPLPIPGKAHLQVALASPNRPLLQAQWIWAPVLHDNQTVWLWRAFELSQHPLSAILHITCDDQFQAYLNGKLIGSGRDFHKVSAIKGLERLLHPGKNTLAVRCYNGTGPAGLLAHLEIRCSRATISIASDNLWKSALQPPPHWPLPSEPAGPAGVVANVGSGVWGSNLQGWPGISPNNLFTTDSPIPSGLVRSNVVTVNVVPWHPAPRAYDHDHLVGVEWEPWFTPLNITWNTAEAVPVEGFYSSYDPLVARLHLLWMIRCGIDFILVDWSNNLWGKHHWAERSPGVDELIRGTDVLFQQAAKLKQEGLPVPRITLLLGLNNGPYTTTTALNEEMDWVYHHYLQNPVFRPLWLKAYGKPLIVLFNGPGPSDLQGQEPIDMSHFTVRWMASQLQNAHFERFGYWSWMDGTLSPIPTYYQGKPEALTITIAFFGDGGWLYPPAMGHENGYTYLKEWQTAFSIRPRFLLICQWNEFAGQPKASGYGPKHDVYVDCFSPELSNDIEPTSLTTPAYRGNGGWGYFYLNLTQAAIQLYHSQAPHEGLLALAPPQKMGDSLVFQWAYLGDKPSSFRLWLDGVPLPTRGLDVQQSLYRLPLEGLRDGRHRIKVEAEGVFSPFAISLLHEDERRYGTFYPVAAEEEFTK